MIPTTLSVRSLDQILEFAEKKSISRDKFIPIFCIVDRRKKMHRELVQQGIRRYRALT